ncbi:hypothetical protein H8356DRAFT_1353053 [Neocallimastix lanati (nom. inval.)]|nr:hypothetical protein H8356DRAFT_1353053 [Neocallimastix sp. JGI-2020a]
MIFSNNLNTVNIEAYNPQTPEIKINFITLIAECLDPFRINYGEPITVSSGFRNQESTHKKIKLWNLQPWSGT